MTRTGVLLIALTIAFGGSRADASPITYEYFQTSTSVPGVVVEASITVDELFTGFPSLSLSCPSGGPLCSYSENGSTTTINLLGPSCPPLPLNCQISPNFGDLLDFTLNLKDGPGVSLGSFRTLWSGKQWDMVGNSIFYNDGGTAFALGFSTTGAESGISFASEAGGGCYLQRCFSNGEWVPTPEPGSMLLMASGLAALVARFHRRRVAYK